MKASLLLAAFFLSLSASKAALPRLKVRYVRRPLY